MLAFHAANCEQANHRHREKHISRRIGERDRAAADVADREDVVDVELVDRVEGHAPGSSSIVPAGERLLRGWSATVSS
ncbi:MAG TPA: hypothetical protein VNZ53_29420 [Steroidobacteraceae bacterium]|nr:hypothetical protein [Steroidobacteraceae bacterium]